MFGSKKNKHRRIAIVDIGSASAGLGVINVNKNEPVEIVFNTRVRTNVGEINSFQVFIKNILGALEESIVIAEKEKHKIDEVRVFLSSPFYLCQTNLIKQIEEKSSTVTERKVKNSLIKASEAFQAKNKALYPELVGDEIIILENELMQIKLNGYHTSKPYGKKVKEISMAHYVSLSSKIVINKLKEVLTKNFPHRKITFHSFSWVVFEFVKAWQSNKNVTILDVTGEVSDLTVITDGYLTETASFPRGRNFLIKSLATSLGTTPAEAYSSLKLFLEEKLDNQPAQKMNEALEVAKKEWLEQLNEALMVVMETVLLPEQIYLIGDDVVTDIFSGWLTDSSLREFSLANQPLKARQIKESDLETYIITKSQGGHDPFFPIESLFCQKVL